MKAIQYDQFGFRDDQPVFGEAFSRHPAKVIYAFPTPVGMNRVYSFDRDNFRRVPHTCGDEPLVLILKRVCLLAFPTPVGMNRNRMFLLLRGLSVPHTCGDEPTKCKLKCYLL